MEGTSCVGASPVCFLCGVVCRGIQCNMHICVIVGRIPKRCIIYGYTT